MAKKTVLIKLTKNEKEFISCKIESEGFDYYFIDYGPDEKLMQLAGKEIEAYRQAHSALVQVLWELEIEL